MNRWSKIAISSGLVLGGFAGLRWWMGRDYPYGFTHCCDKGIYFMLLQWADEHDGKFPDAGSSAASLALLIQNESDVPMIAGKAINPEKAIAYFRIHHTLSDDLCSWHYVPGLTPQSPADMAIVWDTTGLSHNGKANHPAQHEYITLHGTEVVSDAGWPGFLAKQAEYRKEAAASPGPE